MMRLLILGGTLFVGRHVVEAAAGRGWDVTVFTRGKTDPGAFPPESFPTVTHLRGDRERDLSALESGEWDAVVDTWARVPSLVRASATTLAGRAGRYVFVSSISVYPVGTAPGFDEDAPTRPPADPSEPWNPDRYGELKVACEREAEAAFGERTLIVRPGLIVGPYDSSDRFTYWPDRMARGGTVLAPGRPERLVQIVDGRDLAGWMLDMIAREESGAWNATGPAWPFGEVLDACAQAAGSQPRIEWVDEEWLLARDVQPWTEMPVWLPESSEDAYLFAANASRAASAGLRTRPAEHSARDALAWRRDSGEPPLKAGMDPAREAALLEEWARR